ncbi:beta-1,3-glucanase family protein [Polynucleobacter sp. JS-JIR-II-c23]|uniref:beta-1,3-glucanase family protein n=1 Tax=Polynucleobacter sp. JS-JIR-II-c23 TaxID=1758393 RepID=UPI002B22284C|nr:beta-1,3-glucanase family protein [Polynucleobacter sp. JS-JIR-II-c23]MEA9603828.1 beta-1,3-glucanase family protein [Polynucleobacter sp. JS-JIR-II-c23]
MKKINENRRLILKGVGALGTSGILIACGGGSSGGSSSSSSGGGTSSKGTSAPVCAGALATIPLTIDASVGATGIPATVPMYAYIVGLTAAGGNTYYRYKSATGPVEMNPTADNTNAAGTCAGMTTGSTSATTNCPTVWADYSLPLDRSCATLVADLALFSNIPNLGTGTNAFSGRIYISIGKPLLPFTPLAGVNTNQTTGFPATGYTAPALASGTPGSLSLYDWLEFSFDSNQALNINTTQVDQFGFPISMTATGTGMTGGEQGVLNTSRSSILSNLASLSNALFNSSVAVPTTGVSADAYPASVYTANTLRAVSPKTVATASDTFFTSTIATWYSNWTSTPVVTYDAASGYYSGMVSGGVLSFKTGNLASASSWNSGGSVQFTNTQITSYDVWQCANSLASGSGAQKNVQKMIAAAFQRGTMANANYSLNDTLGASFSPPLSGNYASSTSNTWAQKFHQFNTNGLAYGFPYDDVGSLQPTVTTSSGTTSLSIQVGLFL